MLFGITWQGSKLWVGVVTLYWNILLHQVDVQVALWLQVLKGREKLCRKAMMKLESR